MYIIEKTANFLIQKTFKKNIFENESEVEYWDRHWEKSITYFKKHGSPLEIKELWWKNLYDEMTLHYSKLLNGLENKYICELGCGSGYSSLLMAKQGAKVTLVDFSLKAKSYSKMLIDYLNIPNENINFITVDIFNMKNNKIYDVVWNCGVIEHCGWNDAVNMIKKMKSNVKPGGSVIVTLPNLLSPQLLYKMIEEGKGSENYFSHRLLRKLMIEAGLCNVRTEAINYWVPSFLHSDYANKARNMNICKYFKSLAWLFSGIGMTNF